MNTHNRLRPDDREEQILDAALHVACSDGLASLCTRAVAKRLNCARSLISHYYSIETLRDLVVMRAAAEGCVKVVAQAIATDETLAPRLGDVVHGKAIAYLAGGRTCLSDCPVRKCRLDSQPDRP